MQIFSALERQVNQRALSVFDVESVVQKMKHQIDHERKEITIWCNTRLFAENLMKYEYQNYTDYLIRRVHFNDGTETLVLRKGFPPTWRGDVIEN